jgi:phage tail sheath protein FI
MPYYFDNNGNPKAQYAPFMPANSNVSGTFGAAVGSVAPGANFYNTINGTNTQGLSANSYTASVALLSNQDAYQFNVLVTPGLYNSDTNYGSVMTTVINNTQNRGDNIYIADLVPYSSSVNTVTTQAGQRNTSYAASYWPWVQIVEPDSGQLVWVPASTVMPGVFAYNDTVSEPWFAPAGINRGGLNLVVRAETKLTQTQRDNLYSGNVNPIATFPANGVVVYGQKTLQKKASALDRVNVRRLLIALKNYISEVAQNLVFEQNTIATRNAFLAAVNPYLETVQQKQGLYAFKVIMDDSNNPADVIDRNQMVGQIYIQPTKTAEFIYLDFNILPTGATFPG